VQALRLPAWQQRRLIFRWASLGDMVEEFNRYNSSPRIRIESPALSERRYTAVFDADAPRELLKFLERDGGVSVTLAGDEWVIGER
jgi:ferric-dicitrate binding protein FerR (iron transport regulator)